MIEEVKAHVVLGKDAEDFLDSDLGRAILGMAKQDADAATDLFARVNASDISQVVEAQVQIRTAMRFAQYLVELITRGKEEFAAYKQQKEEN